ncbi:hypothetical protein [Vibrio campbellii]|uniref:hypothetical protein n=1 Tax=Vibrio campbellii TaxID=680 RepID=UPI000CD37747|nr:hypothetical protein [Vibrio campbellii]AUW07407.1 hypothetical protein C1N51_27515 [Vibrio campbellii]
MHKPTIVGIITSALSLVATAVGLTFDANFQLEEVPLQAFQTLVFIVTWMLGTHPVVSYPVSVMVVITILIISFGIGYRVTYYAMSKRNPYK